MVFCLENEEARCPLGSTMVQFQASEVQQLLHNKFVVILGDSSECPSRITLPGPTPAASFLHLNPLPPSQITFLIPSLEQSSRFSLYFPNALHRCPDRCSLSSFSPHPCSAFFFLTVPHNVPHGSSGLCRLSLG